MILAQKSWTVCSKAYGIGTITAEIQFIQGNKSAHFSLNADFKNVCGWMPEEILRLRPDLKPLVEMHLSDSPSGKPMHAFENGFYWLAGVVGGLGEQFHGEQDYKKEECLKNAANLLRISYITALSLANRMKDLFDHIGNGAAKNFLRDFIEKQESRWANEALAANDMIESKE